MSDIKIMLSSSLLWKKVRLGKILRQHRKAADICAGLVASHSVEDDLLSVKPKKAFADDRIIWQFWAQGYTDVPEVIRTCLDSVDKYCGKDFSIVRLSDDNLEEYLDLPDWLIEKRQSYSVAFFSDLLRVLLLELYGGVWIDATVMLSAAIPVDYLKQDFFVFQRDVSEQNKEYWENTYAYYFGWAKGFRVNMLSSFMCAKKGTPLIGALCTNMIKWWHDNDYLPDYFFLQILFDVLVKGVIKEYNCPIVSDCPPHYLQQCINDPKFKLMTKEEILSKIPIHKLTYK